MRARRQPRSLRRAEEEDEDDMIMFGESAVRQMPINAEMYGDSIWFDVTLKKPFGMRLVDGPGGPLTGVGVGEIAEEGSVVDLFRDILTSWKEKKPPKSMWVQEGDELVAVNGKSTEDSRELATEMIMDSGEEATMTFSRRRKGPIKVVFPGGLQVTSPRMAQLNRLADKVGYDCGCNCKDGKCGKCWHRCPATGEIYILPLNCGGITPSAFRKSGDQGMRPGEGEQECWIPLVLEPAPEAFAAEMKKEALKKATMT